MWKEYVKMELGFIEGLRRRWDVLGITIAEDGKGKEKASEMPMDLDGNEATEQMQVDIDPQGTNEDRLRKVIMGGAIVKPVISSAAKGKCLVPRVPGTSLPRQFFSWPDMIIPVTALPKIELFTSLHNLITTYPSPPSLRESLLDHLLAELQTTLPDEPLGLKLSATRALTPDVDGEVLIEALKNANENLLGAVKNKGRNGESFLHAYAEFVEEWCRPGIDANLVRRYFRACVTLTDLWLHSGFI
jgi:U3 small nucleolar RNA-associated protein 6